MAELIDELLALCDGVDQHAVRTMSSG